MENDTQNAWLTNNSKTIDDLQKNKTNFNEYVNETRDGYNARMKTWNAGFYNNLSSVIPSTLESEIEYVLNREAKPTMPRSYIEGYLNAVAYTYDR